MQTDQALPYFLRKVRVLSQIPLINWQDKVEPLSLFPLPLSERMEIQQLQKQYIDLFHV